MHQRTFEFPDEEGSKAAAQAFDPPPFNPDVERILSEIAMEEELARLSPEDRQRHFARLAAEERQAARASRRPC